MQLKYPSTNFSLTSFNYKRKFSVVNLVKFLFFLSQFLLFLFFIYNQGILISYLILFLFFHNSLIAALFSPTLILLVNTEIALFFLAFFLFSVLLGFLKQKAGIFDYRIIVSLLFVVFAYFFLLGDVSSSFLVINFLSNLIVLLVCSLIDEKE
jgi:hypothetical protein